MRTKALTTLEELRRAVEPALDASLPPEAAWPATIHRAVRYSLFAGGKRIRPVLSLAAGEAAGGPRDEVLPLACAVEMIHTYSLIHDDLPAMDDDDLRRGKPTSHKVFGEGIAILAGDALLTRAFHLLSEMPPEWDETRLRRRVRALALLGEACGTTGLIGGQVEDLESEGQTIDAAALECLHRAKTGALLSACVRGGAILGGASETDLASLTRYAAAIGLAFQVVGRCPRRDGGRRHARQDRGQGPDGGQGDICQPSRPRPGPGDDSLVGARGARRAGSPGLARPATGRDRTADRGP